MSKILIVDDETEFVEMLAFRLSKVGGYEVLTANNGEEGLLKARRDNPDLILLDVWMPKMDGYQVIQELKASAETAQLPVIFLTASALPQTLEKLKAVGAADYIIKPFNPPELLDKIKKGLESRHV